MRIGIETIRAVRRRLNEKKTYDEIQREFGIARATIAKIAKLSLADIKSLEKEAKKEKEIEKEELFKTGAEKVLLKEIKDIIADESLKRIRELYNYGLLLEEKYNEMEAEKLLKLIQSKEKEEIKNCLMSWLVYFYLSGRISKQDFLRKFLTVKFG